MRFIPGIPQLGAIASFPLPSNVETIQVEMPDGKGFAVAIVASTPGGVNITWLDAAGAEAIGGELIKLAEACKAGIQIADDMPVGMDETKTASGLIVKK